MADDGLSLLEQIENIVKNESQNTFWRKKATLIRVLVISSCLLLIMFISYSLIYSRHFTSSGYVYKSDKPDNISTEIYVDLSGAVNKPGVYVLEPDTRLFMIIL